MSDALDILRPPSLVEEIHREEIEKRKLAIFLQEYKEQTGEDFTDLQESNIVVRLIRASAIEEERQRQRINERFRARMVYFSRGENLRELARNDGLEVGDETDLELQQRIVDGRTGSSSAGPPEWYIRKANDAAPGQIEKINFDFPDQSSIRVAILAKNETGIPNQDLIDKVQAKLTAPDVHADDHTSIEVVGAQAVSVHVRAKLTLEPNTDIAILEAIKEHFKQAFQQRRALGRNVPWSWISAQLQQSGVFAVEDAGTVSPEIARHQVAKLESIDISISQGRAQ